ncbi:MAG: hypothetical protein WBB45_15880 [Cyclobacteriaceae bacterium]
MDVYYKPLFTVNFSHDFYKNGRSSDLVAVPVPETKKKLAGNKLLFKHLDTGFKVLFQAQDFAGTPYVDQSDTRYTFALYHRGTRGFTGFTDMSDSGTPYSGGNLLHFHNDPPATADMTHRLVAGARNMLFTYTLPFAATDPATHEASLEVQNSAGDTVIPSYNITPAEDGGAYHTQIDLRGFPAGRYTLRIQDDTHPLETVEYYLSHELAATGLLGVLEIDYSAAALDAYDLTLTRKSTFWKYYIVNKTGRTDLGTTTLDLTDTSGDSGTPYATYSFTRGPVPDPTAIQGLETVVFTSDSQIPFHEQPKLGLSLTRTPDDNPVLFDHLPNPSATAVPNSANESEIYVFI